MRKIIITGVNGFIGGALAKFYLKRGFYVVGIGQSSVSRIRDIAYFQIDLINDDITKILEKVMPDCIIHCAGMADVNYSINHPDSDLFSCVVMTQRILYQMLNAKVKCRFIHMSSAAVYGQPDRLPIKETNVLSPLSPYALHKQMAENICLYFIKQHGMDIKILRIFSAYGPGLKKQLFWDMGKKIVHTQQLELFGSGEESRDYIYIDDLVEAIYCIMKYADENSGDIINVASGVEIKIKQVAFIFAEKWGLSLDDIKFNGVSRTGNPINWCADITKLSELGFMPNTSIEQGIGKYIKWFRDHY